MQTRARACVVGFRGVRSVFGKRARSRLEAGRTAPLRGASACLLRTELRAFEVTPEGRIVWEFLNPLINEEGRRSCIERMKRYEPAFVDRIVEKSAGHDAGPRP